MLNRILAIYRAHLGEPLSPGRALLILGGAATVMLLNWLGTYWEGDDLRWFGLDLQGYNDEFGHKALTANAFFCERLWYVWLFVTLFYWVPAVLLPLSRSFTQSGTHWIRLTSASPLEALLGRVMPALVVATGLLGVNALWMTLVYFTRGGQAPVLAVAPVGAFAYYVFTIGCVIHPSVRAAGNHQSANIILIATVSPILLWLLAWMCRPTGDETGWRQYAAWWPYVVPFQGYWDSDFWKHLATFALGAAGLFVSAALTVGRQVTLPDSTSLSPGEGK